VHPYPHVYRVSASGRPGGNIPVAATGLPDIETNAPAEFDGPGDLWSPETMLCASVANCFILTFRAIARASKLEWNELDCRVDGVLDRVDGVTQFSRFTTHATLKIPPASDAAKARALLEKAEDRCLVTNSLRGTQALVAEVVQAG